MAEFDHSIYKKFDSSYLATETVINQIRNHPDIHSFMDDYDEYLINEAKKSAVVLKYVVRKTTKAFLTKSYKQTKIEYDIAKRCTTVSNGIRLIRKFFNIYPNFDIVVPCGSLSHECCVFFRKDAAGKFRAIYFNPNFSTIQNGVESSKIVKELFVMMRGALVEKRSFYSPCGNVDGECSALTWKKVHDLVCDGSTPFMDHSLHLEDYSHNTTLASYNRYKSQQKQKNAGK